jgi:hypothetical protein
MTARLPRIRVDEARQGDRQRPPSRPMQSGIFWGYVA